MGRWKLAICLNDKEYRNRLVKCMMNHYSERYEFHVFENPEELLATNPEAYDGFLVSESIVEDSSRVLELTEENMYREVYRIVQDLEMILGDVQAIPGGHKSSELRRIGILSLAAAQMQLSFSTMLAEICSEEGKTLVLDLQAYSGLTGLTEDTTPGLEDIMAAAAMGDITKNRLQSVIGHRNTWDYIYPVKNASYLQEGTPDMLRRILQAVSDSKEYQTVIVSLGEGFGSWQELVEQFDTCYFLYPRGNVGSWREEAFLREMQRRGSGEALHRICRIEIPAVAGQTDDWEAVGTGWKWGALGDQMRKQLAEVGYGKAL